MDKRTTWRTNARSSGSVPASFRRVCESRRAVLFSTWPGGGLWGPTRAIIRTISDTWRATWFSTFRSRTTLGHSWPFLTAPPQFYPITTPLSIFKSLLGIPLSLEVELTLKNGTTGGSGVVRTSKVRAINTSPISG